MIQTITQLMLVDISQCLSYQTKERTTVHTQYQLDNMAKIHGKPNEMTEMKVSDLTEEQIIDLAKWANILNEENKNLKGYIVQLQAQLKTARGQRAVAEHRLNQQTTEWVVQTGFDNDNGIITNE